MNQFEQSRQQLKAVNVYFYIIRIEMNLIDFNLIRMWHLCGYIQYINKEKEKFFGFDFFKRKKEHIQREQRNNRRKRDTKRVTSKEQLCKDKHESCSVLLDV